MHSTDIQAWGEFLIGIGAMLNVVMNVFVWINSHRTRQEMGELSANTNSIKDALVKATGEAADSAGYERGRLAGEAKAATLAEGRLAGEDAVHRNP